ncbi:hypothetical protein E3N88_26706 [Mikania micrantha]|uniref:Armadillo repeat-containing domain-containing protein n=1 Tax=Mikania micrantha TaxID=192012 RepID=A0A5N6MXA4_9ASTR|nr:hypothetical protein E3N88_26706 [Mikania micrantha]
MLLSNGNPFNAINIENKQLYEYSRNHKRSENWNKLPNLEGLDVSRTKLVPIIVMRVLNKMFKNGQPSGLATFVVVDYAIANLSLNLAFTKSVAGSGCITVLTSLAISMNRLIIIIKEVIAIAGVIRDLVDLILKWSRGGDRVLKGVVGALTNLAADDKCSMEIAAVGGTSALVTLACKCKHEGVQRFVVIMEQAAHALANLTVHGDSNTNDAEVGQEAGAIDALLLHVCSQHNCVKQEAENGSH